MFYEVPDKLPETPITIERMEAFAKKHGQRSEDVCGGLLGKALNRANEILGRLGTVIFDQQAHMPRCEGPKLSVTPIVDGKDVKGRVLEFIMQIADNKILNIGAISIMQHPRDEENIEDVEVLAHRIALVALSHLAVEKSGVVDFDGLKLDMAEKEICHIGSDQGCLTVDKAKVFVDCSKPDKPQYFLLRCNQIKSALPQHFANFSDLGVVMMYDSGISEDNYKEEFYFDYKNKTPEGHARFFRLDAPLHRETKAWEGDIEALKEARLEVIATKDEWKKTYDVDLYPESGLEGLKQQIDDLKWDAGQSLEI